MFCAPRRGAPEALEEARAWGAEFVSWYSTERRPSGIRYVTPAQRHAEENQAIVDARHPLYQAAREANPARWSGQTRNWSPIMTVTLNPERHGRGATVTEATESVRLAA